MRGVLCRSMTRSFPLCACASKYSHSVRLKSCAAIIKTIGELSKTCSCCYILTLYMIAKNRPSTQHKTPPLHLCSLFYYCTHTILQYKRVLSLLLSVRRGLKPVAQPVFSTKTDPGLSSAPSPTPQHLLAAVATGVWLSRRSSRYADKFLAIADRSTKQNRARRTAFRETPRHSSIATKRVGCDSQPIFLGSAARYRSALARKHTEEHPPCGSLRLFTQCMDE